MPATQVNFAAFAAAFVCPPPAANDAAPAVTAPAVSGQGVDTRVVNWIPSSRQICALDVQGGWQGDWYLDWQSLGGCLDATDFLPSGGTVACPQSGPGGGFYADGFSTRRD